MTLILRRIGRGRTGLGRIDDDFFGRNFNDLAVAPNDDGDAGLFMTEASFTAGALHCLINLIAVDADSIYVNGRLQAANHIGLSIVAKELVFQRPSPFYHHLEPQVLD